MFLSIDVIFMAKRPSFLHAAIVASLQPNEDVRPSLDLSDHQADAVTSFDPPNVSPQLKPLVARHIDSAFASSRRSSDHPEVQPHAADLADIDLDNIESFRSPYSSVPVRRHR